MKYQLAFLTALICIFHSEAQNIDKNFEAVYYKVAANITGSDPQEAIRIADSLYRHSRNASHKVRSLMLKANVYSSIGDVKEAIEIATIAEEQSEENKMIEGQAKILGFLSTQYRNLGLLKKGRTCLQKGLQLVPKITDMRKARQFYGLTLQETAYYDRAENKHSQALQALRKADSVFRLLENGNEKYFNLALNEEMQGKEHLILKHFDTSIRHYRRSENYLRLAQAEQSGMLGFIYNGKGEAFFNLSRLDSAFHYLKLAEQVAKSSAHADLAPMVYGNLAAYHFKTDNIKEYNVYIQKKDSVNAVQKTRDQHLSDDIADDLANKTTLLERNYQAGLLILGALLVLSTAFLFIRSRKRNKRDETADVASEDHTENNQIPTLAHDENDPQAPQIKPDSDIGERQLVPIETERLLLQRLSKFEKKEKFRKKNLTLASLSTSLETNTKYLSYVINKNKGGDFNSYINRLRIDYIVAKMKSDESYLHFKIGYLAEESGFSSHSKFSAVFRDVMMHPPSEFIASLREENDRSKEENNTPKA